MVTQAGKGGVGITPAPPFPLPPPGARTAMRVAWRRHDYMLTRIRTFTRKRGEES